MIVRLSALPRLLVQSARAVGLAAGILALALAVRPCTADAGPRDFRAAQTSAGATADDRRDLAQAQPLGRFGWRGGGRRFAMGGLRAERGFGRRGMMRPRAAAYAWAVPAGDMPQMRRQPGYFQTVQYGGGGGGRWGWRGGRGGGGGGRGGFQAPDAAARSLRNQGYSNVDPLTRRGRSYVGEATGPKGQRQRVIIDGSNGRVMGVSPLGPPVAMPPPGAGWYGGY